MCECKKYYFLKKLLLLLISLNAFSNLYALPFHEILAEKLRFYYVPQPNSASINPIVLDNAAIQSGNETGSFWANKSMKTVQEFVRSLLKDSEQGGDVELQYYASEIIQLLNKPVQVWLYNDFNARLNMIAISKYNPCLDNQDRVWPCAANTPDNEYWAGFMHLGAVNTTHYGLKWTKSTFLHELVHTQDQSDSRGHIFYVHGKDWSYGADEDHYITEAIPNMALVYMEGIANTVSYIYDEVEAQRGFDWFSNNDRLIVETGVPVLPQTDRYWNPIFLYDKIKAEMGPGEQFTDASLAGYRGYKIRELSPYFIIHNEQILALIFSQYVRHIGFPNFLDALKKSNNELLRVCASGVAILFARLCEEGLPTTENWNLEDFKIENVYGIQRDTHLLPLAYADYFTAYKSGEDKEAFSGIFEGLLPSNWIDKYWDSHARRAVRSAVPIGSGKALNINDLTNIAIALGIDMSIGE